LFAACEKPRTQLRTIVDRARAIGPCDNISEMDALHVAAAEIAACEIFVATEKPDPRRKQVHRTSGIEVQFIGEFRESAAGFPRLLVLGYLRQPLERVGPF
jgi:hypothetical protein